jgi:general secretion pathway protein H
MKALSGEIGFTLIEIVCVLAILAMLAAVALPALPRGTSRPMLEALAISAAALLTSDRNAALRLGVPVETGINTMSRTISSGSSGALLRVPGDVGFSAVLAATCNHHDAGTTISFFASGLSCGGALSLSRLGAVIEIRVAWLTGAVEIVEKNTL